MPSSQPVQRFSKRVSRGGESDGLTMHKEKRTTNNAANANLGDEIAASYRGIESRIKLSTALGKKLVEMLVRDSLVSFLIHLAFIVKPSWVIRQTCVSRQGDVVLPVYSIATSSCFLGTLMPLPFRMTALSTPILVAWGRRIEQGVR